MINSIQYAHILCIFPRWNKILLNQVPIKYAYTYKKVVFFHVVSQTWQGLCLLLKVYRVFFLKNKDRKALTNPLFNSLWKLECTEVSRSTPVQFRHHWIVPGAACVSKLFHAQTDKQNFSVANSPLSLYPCSKQKNLTTSPKFTDISHFSSWASGQVSVYYFPLYGGGVTCLFQLLSMQLR